MALSIHEYLYRIRINFNMDGAPELAETVKKAAVLNDGQVSAQSDSELKTVTASKLQPEIDALLARFNIIWTEEEAERVAEAARIEAEKAEAARLEAETKAAAEAQG